MTISVVLPTYERAGVVGGAIDSVLAQTHRDLELIVVDGGIDDGTSAVVTGYDDARVQYLRQSARNGVSAARNRGVEAADGEFVAFIDSDDRWRPEKLERQVAALRDAEGDPAVSYCRIAKTVGQPLVREGRSGDVYEAVRRMDVPTSPRRFSSAGTRFRRAADSTSDCHASRTGSSASDSLAITGSSP